MALRFLTGGGTMGAALRKHDGSTSELGAPEGWPSLLKNLVGIALGSSQPMMVLWGDALLVLCNDSALEIFGETDSAVIAQPFAQVWSEAADALSIFLKCANAGETARADNIRLNLRHNGRSIYNSVSLSFVPVTDEGSGVVGVLCTGMQTSAGVDVEGHVAKAAPNAEAVEQSNERLHQFQKMQALKHLAAGVAHDFNNYLAGIYVSVQLMQRKLKLGKVDDLHKLLERAMTSSQHATAYTQTLLALAGRQPLELKAVDMAELLPLLREKMHMALGPGIELSIVPAASLWWASTDALQIEKALLELFKNAREAMPNGGLLTLSIANQRMVAAGAAGEGELKAGDYLMLLCTDNGVGMSETALSRAFEPFFTTKAAGQHAGLGLSMLYGFASQTGGHVSIKSVLNKGTAVRLYLPRHQFDTARPQP